MKFCAAIGPPGGIIGRCNMFGIPGRIGIAPETGPPGFIGIAPGGNAPGGGVIGIASGGTMPVPSGAIVGVVIIC